VTYHDLVFENDRVLSDLMRWMGLQYEPSQEQYWNAAHHCSVKPAYMRPPENNEVIFDQRWKTLLSEKAKIAAFSHPDINAYLDSLNIKYDWDKGLILNACPASRVGCDNVK